MKNNEGKIDIAGFLKVVIQEKICVMSIVVICIVVALLLTFILPKKYEATTLVQTRKTGGGTSMGVAAMAASLGFSGVGSSGNSTYTYIELMKSRTVLDPIIKDLDWDEDEKEYLTAEKFAKKNLKIDNVGMQTNLIQIKATGKTPEEAQKISQSVADNFLIMQTNMNKETQSLLVKFLSNRIDESKKNAEEASAKFAEYQKEHKVYSPTEQAKVTVAKMEAFDKAIGEMEVQEKASQAELDTASSKLGEMKASSQSYQINDNANVQGIRNQIVAKELQLVNLNQHYTENHPSVITAKQELNQLERSLANEVNAVVSSNATSMNPAQAELLKSQAMAQARIAVAQASKIAIEGQRDEKQKELGDFPNEIMEYMNLQRDATIKNEIYIALVKQCEQDKIQEAMDSMDIQIVDPAELPFIEKPAFPKKSMFAVIGFIVGVVIAFGRCTLIYRKSKF